MFTVVINRLTEQKHYGCEDFHIRPGHDSGPLSNFASFHSFHRQIHRPRTRIAGFP